MWWEQPDGTSGLGGLSTADLPLYGIDRLNGSATVILVEGEKAAEALFAAGIQAVGTVTGASGTPGAIPLAELTGLRVHVWPDNDGVGRSHMARTGGALVGIAAAVSIIDWSDAPEHGDAADFLAAGGARKGVEALVAAALPLPASAAPGPAHVRSEPWEPPLSLDRRADLPAFPIAGLPDWLRSFVLAEVEATQTPVDMAAMFVLAALATVAAGHAQVEPEVGWFEGLNLFIVVAMEPGSRKSAVHRDIINPILVHERLLVELAQPDIAEQATIRRIAESSLARTEKAAASAKERIERLAFEDEARTLAAALDRLDVPAAPRLFTADVTPEKLASLLHENQGHMALLSAEAGIFGIMAGRYSSGMPNIDVYLAGHAGDPIRVDRRGRPPEFIDRPALTIGLAVQPYVLAKAARVSDFAGRGLLDRFLYAIPAGTVGYRQTGTLPVPEAIRQGYDTTLRALAATFDRFAEPVTLHLGTEASALFSAWRAEIEPRRRPDADLGHIQGWSSKLDGAVVRIAGLLHLAGTITSGWGGRSAPRRCPPPLRSGSTSSPMRSRRSTTWALILVSKRRGGSGAGLLRAVTLRSRSVRCSVSSGGRRSSQPSSGSRQALLPSTSTAGFASSRSSGALADRRVAMRRTPRSSSRHGQNGRNPPGVPTPRTFCPFRPWIPRDANPPHPIPMP
jgi:hypothetical protein